MVFRPGVSRDATPDGLDHFCGGKSRRKDMNYGSWSSDYGVRYFFPKFMVGVADQD